MDLTTRSYETETMDDLNCSGEVVSQTLRELEFINKWLGGNAVTLDAVKKVSREINKKEITLVDLGCGGGDMLRLIYHWGKSNGIKFHLGGIDANPNIIQYAKDNLTDIPGVSLSTMDIFSNEFKSIHCDIIIGTLFFHHFTKEQLVAFFRQLRSQVREAVIINDIHRHPLAFHSIRLLTKAFSKSFMVINDAPLSVQRAFTKRELQEMFSEAGYKRVSIQWKWAFRWELIAYTK
jgi:ubiquinone/menaquinone biosynthesis C-methylase UbiE